MNLYKQSTYETCLAVSLLHILDIVPNRKKEIEIWRKGWNFNFLEGQLNAVVGQYSVSLNVFVGSKIYGEYLCSHVYSNIHIIHQKIDSKFIFCLVKEKPIIVYLDNYFLQKKLHAPHFVVVLESTQKCLKIFDPWDGREKLISLNTFQKGVKSLETYLKFSPIVIQRTDLG